MGMIAFDTLKLARRLRGAGLPAEQAEAIAEAEAEAFDAVVSEKLATKEDVQALRGDIRLVQERLEQTVTRAEMERRFGDMERRFGDMEKRFGELRAEMEKRFGDMEKRFGEQIRWIAGLLIAQAGLIVALVRLLG